MRILHSADWHILLDKKKVPYEWQYNRFQQFFDALLAIEHDIHIISGDVFDRKPESDEIALLLTYLNRVTKETRIIPGNHEATKKGKSFLTHFTQEHAISNPLVKIYTTNTREQIKGQWFTFFPYGEMQLDRLPTRYQEDILVTHIRGEVPPHITAEYDFNKLRPWKLILLGDLHFHHKYQDLPAYYSGSPVNVSFDRDDRNEYGVNLIEFDSIDKYTVKFVNLKLPKLIRKTVSSQDEMVPGDYDHVIYEVTGSLDQLANIKQSKLLDKRIVTRPKETSKLNLIGLSIKEELVKYLEYSNVEDVSAIVTEFEELKIET
jgi:DNA repair exonuclease SbcCD nuclease subunit